jgi:membrane protein
MGTHLREWLPVRVARRYLASNAGHWASNMAWNALFSFVPTLLLLASLVGFLFGSHRFEDYLARQMAILFHTRPADVLTVFNEVHDKSWILAVVSLALLIWSGSSLFSCVDCGLSGLSGIEPRPFLRRRWRAMGMTAVFCLVLIPLLVSSSLLSVPRGHLAPLDAAARYGNVWLYLAQFVLGAAFATLLFAVVYKAAPNRHQRIVRVLPGAVCAGALLELLTLIFPIYFRASATSGGALVLILALPVLLTFFYCVGQVIVIGHLLNLETGDGAPAS